MKKLLLSLCMALGFVSFDAKAVDIIYQGQVPYTTTNPAGVSPGRTPADRASDHGVNILEFGAFRNSLGQDSSGAIQSAIDACYNQTGCRNVFCPDGDYMLYQSVFLDPPNSLRGGAPWTAAPYVPGDIVTVGGTYYRSTANHANTDPTPPTTGWTTTPPPIYASGSTYSAGDTVIANGIMWKSIVGSNTGNTPSNLSTFWKQTVESGNTNSNWGPSFTGTTGQDGGAHPSGCRIFVRTGNFPAMWVLGNGIHLESVHLRNSATGLYRCQNDPALVGFAMAGGGSSLTTFRNVGVLNFYAGIETSTNGVDSVNDSNYFDRVQISGACRGLWFPGTQNFLNTIMESRVEESRINVHASQNNGVSIYGGNYTTSSTRSNTFSMSGVTLNISSGSPFRLTATLASNPAGTWPDNNLTTAGCSGANDATFTASATAGVLTVSAPPSSGTLAVYDYVYNPGNLSMAQITSFGTGSGGAGTYNLNSAITTSGSETWRSTKRIDYPRGCTYDIFVVKTAAFGNIPFHLINETYGGLNYTGNNWNNVTGQITLQMDIPTSAQWADTFVNAAFKADVEAQGVIYASEVTTSFWPCGADISNAHIENSQAVTTFMNSSCTFGVRKNTMRGTYVNYQPEQTNWATSAPPLYLVQQAVPSVRAYTSLEIDGFDLGGIPADRSLFELSAGNPIVMSNGVLPLNIRLSRLCSNLTFSGSGTACGNGSIGVGAGSFTGVIGGANSSVSLLGTLADQWRGGGVNVAGGFITSQGGPGTTDFIGRRPNPSQASCVSSAFLGNYTGSLPAITTTGAASFTGAISYVSPNWVIDVSGIVGGNNLAQGQQIYGRDMTNVTLGSFVSGTNGGNGRYLVPNPAGAVSAQTMSTLGFSVPYPLLYGGQQYRVCDNLPWTRNSTTTNSFYSNHKFYSLGQPYTSTINPALAWSLKRTSPAIYMDPASLRLLSPGMIMTLTCNSLTKDMMILEVRSTEGYLLILDANQDGAPYVPDFGVDCVGGAGGATLTVGQPAYSVVQF